MSEFSKSDVLEWLKCSLDNSCSLEKAVYYCLYFQCIRDETKFTRAMDFLLAELGINKFESTKHEL